MMRVRGSFDVYFEDAGLLLDFIQWPADVSVQLAPVRNGSVLNTSILSTFNAADQESNRIVWQRLYLPQTNGIQVGPGGERLINSNRIHGEVDIKVKRRFDRALWALVLVIEAGALSGALHHCQGTMRALFSAGDGL